MTLVLALLTFISCLIMKATDAVDWSMQTVTAPLWLWLFAVLVGGVEIAFWKKLNGKKGS